MRCSLLVVVQLGYVVHHITQLDELQQRWRPSVATDAGLLLLVPSENLDSTDHVMPGACFAGQPAVWVKPAWIRSDYRSNRRSGSTAIALPLSCGNRGMSRRHGVVSANAPRFGCTSAVIRADEAAAAAAIL